MNRRFRLIGTALLAIGGTTATGIVVATNAQAATGCAVTYTISSQWSGGFQGDITIKNTADAWSGWKLQFTFPDSAQIVTQSWNSSYTQSGTAVTFTNVSWNAAVATNGSASLGFTANNGSTNPKPTSFAVNGTTCAGSTTSTTASGSASASSSAGASSSSGSGGTRFGLLSATSALPAASQCATQVKAVSSTENKAVNGTANQTTGHTVSGASAPLDQVNGNFTGTTEQILRWAACKWGIDEDYVRAQAAIESWWRQDTKGDWGTDATRCPSNHGLGVDGTAGSCPESYGIMQVRYPYNVAAFPGAETSTAMNVDYAFANWRACYTGSWTWLNTVERGSEYAAGDAWGCMGVWFSGRWHTTAADEYIARVKDYLSQRIWETANFQQP